MAKAKYDGVIEAVRYNPEGCIEWVRAYIRRGAIFSDRILLDRNTLVEQLKTGKNYMVGQRIPLQAGTFVVTRPLRLLKVQDREMVVAGEQAGTCDLLEGAPIV